MTSGGPTPTGDLSADSAERSIEFGIFDWVDALPGSDLAAVFDGRLAMVQAADRGGQIAVYHLAEHHGTPLGMAPSPAVFLAAVSRLTSRIRLAPTVFVLPLYDPMRLAQEIGMLDQLSHGRLDVGLGRGSVPVEGEFYGYDVGAMTKRYGELEPVLLEALATEVFRRPPGDEASVPEIPLFITTIQKPYPPLWYPTTNPDTIPRLAEYGYNTLYGFAWFSPPASGLAAASSVYFAGRLAAEKRGGTVYGVPGRIPRFGTMRHVFIAESESEAIAIGREAIGNFNSNFTYLMRGTIRLSLRRSWTLTSCVLTLKFSSARPRL